MKRVTGTFLACLLLARCTLAVATEPPAAPMNPGNTTHACVACDAAEKLATQVCAACHGPGGNSTSPMFPKLAAQQAAYIAAQIKAFKAHTRGEREAHDYMLGMATLIDDDTAQALGRFFFAEKSSPGSADNAALIGVGKDVFARGIPQRGIAACATCHGATAAGAGI